MTHAGAMHAAGMVAALAGTDRPLVEVAELIGDHTGPGPLPADVADRVDELLAPWLRSLADDER